MENQKGHFIQDESARRHFTMIPRIVIEMNGLSHAAIRLYLWLKKVCGESEDKRCYQTLDTISEGCGMCRQTVVNSRRELEMNELITVEKFRNKDGSKKIFINICDVWELNNRQYDKKTTPLSEGSKQDTNLIQTRDPAESKQGTGIRPLLNKKETSLLPVETGNGVCSVSLDGRKKQKKQPSSFHRRCTKELSKIISTHIKINCKADMKEWSTQFRLMEERDKVPKSNIKEAIQWYGKHIDDEYAIEAYSAKAFRQKYRDVKFAGAMRRSEYKNQSHDTPIVSKEKHELFNQIWNELEKDNWSPGSFVMQEYLDKALVRLGLSPGEISEDEFCEGFS